MAGLPGPLASAINVAARRYGVSPGTLTGIWQIESGSSYPNPYKNSLGYGGLFGTTKYNAPVQEQANYAASILANLIRTRGSLPAALHAYSGGGYSSVPGGGASSVSYKTSSGGGSSAAPPAAPPAPPPPPVTVPTVQRAPQATTPYYTAPTAANAPAVLTPPRLAAGGGNVANAFSGRNAPARRGPVSQTLAQVANQRVNAQLNPQIAAANSFNTRQAQVIQQFAQALMGKLQPIAGQVGQAYNTAIGQTAGLADTSAKYFANANPNASEQALLQSIGAPQAQQQQIATQLGNTFNGGAAALQYTQGTVPGTMLAAQGAAAQAQAAQLPGLAALKGQQDLSSALWQQGQDRRTLEATRPALYQKAAQDIRQSNVARAQLQQKDAAARATAAYRQANINLGYKKANQSAADKAATRAETKAYHDAYFAHVQAGDSERVAHDKATEAAATARIAASQRNADVLAGISEQRVGISQQNANTSAGRAADSAAAATARQATSDARLKLAQRHERAYEKAQTARQAAAARKAGQASAFPNLTKAQVLHLRSGVARAFNGVPADENKGKELPPVDYQTAINEMVQGGYSRAGATKMANRFYMPGQRGRPGGARAGAGAPPGVAGPR